MKIRMIVLAIATIDAWLMALWQQAPVVDTSVWIAVIAGVVGLLTLMIQTYGQVQLARIKDQQTRQDKVLEVQTNKIDKQSNKIAEVHTTVNSGRDKMLEELKALVAEVNTLKGASVERDKSDARVQNQFVGAVSERTRIEGLVAAGNPAAPTPLGTTDAKPMHVEVVNPEPVEVVVVEKPKEPK